MNTHRKQRTMPSAEPANNETAPLEVRWRPRAHLDRESIAIYLAVERNVPSAALAAMKSIDAAIERARLFPEMGGHFRSRSLDHTEYRTVLANPYTVYYRFDSRQLTVYRILHQRQDISDYTLMDMSGILK